MPKAMIITVGEQIEQILFSLNNHKPEFLGLIATNTEQSRSSVDKIIENYKINPSKCKVVYCKDDPSEIGEIIKKFYEIYIWLTEEEKISPSEIIVDPTGGRKWMSAGQIMISSFLGLNMTYVDVKFKDHKPDPSTMKSVSLGNAYEQTGFLEEAKADKLFNEYNYSSAIEIYDFLTKKISDPEKVETIKIKKCIAQAYLLWTQFKFKEAYEWLTSALQKINQFRLFSDFKSKLQKHLSILEILKKNDEKNENNQPLHTYFELLKDKEFPKTVLLFLYSLQNRYAEKKQFDSAVIVLYRILEFIAQYRLAQHDIDTNNVKLETKQQYNDQFKQITKEKDIYNAECEISDKIALMDGWILLYCIKDDLVKDQDNINFLKRLKGKTQPRNLLWIEHKNENVDERKYNDFKKYVVEDWLKKIVPNLDQEYKNYDFVKFN